MLFDNSSLSTQLHMVVNIIKDYDKWSKDIRKTRFSDINLNLYTLKIDVGNIC